MYSECHLQRFYDYQEMRGGKGEWLVALILVAHLVITCQSDCFRFNRSPLRVSGCFDFPICQCLRYCPGRRHTGPSRSTPHRWWADCVHWQSVCCKCLTRHCSRSLLNRSHCLCPSDCCRFRLCCSFWSRLNCVSTPSVAFSIWSCVIHKVSVAQMSAILPSVLKPRFDLNLGQVKCTGKLDSFADSKVFVILRVEISS